MRRELSFLFRVVPSGLRLPTVTWPRRHEVTSTRRSRGKRNPLSAVQTMLQACRKLAESASSPVGHTLVTLLSHICPPHTFSIVLICLFHHVCRSTICKIPANPRKFVGFRFICKASGFPDFYTIARVFRVPSYTNERERDIYVIVNFSYEIV